MESPDETSTPHAALISYLASLVELLVKNFIIRKYATAFFPQYLNHCKQ